MTDLLIKPKSPDESGCIQKITPESAGWEYVGFAVHDLAPGNELKHHAAKREICLVVLTGMATVRAGSKSWSQVGGRSSVFSGDPPEAVYIPAGLDWSVAAETKMEVAVCSAPGVGNDLPPRRITQSGMSRETRGEGSNTRHVCNILPEDQPADSLLVVEVITPAGNWSSYPPHKHDKEDAGLETRLEEIYYHRVDPASGFVLQRVYTDDRTLDETVAAENYDVVLVPRGYHPVGVPHGYQSYYLNVMAGPKREWMFRNDPEHDWIVRKN